MSIINWAQVKTVLLDMDGTLLDLRFDNYFWQEYVIEVYAKTHNEELEQARTHIMELVDGQRGHLNWYCLDYWSDVLRLNVASLKHDVRDKISLRPGTLSFLQWLQAQAVEVVLCTNAHPAAVAIKLKESGIEKYFHHIVSSHELGAAKENALFWQNFHKLYDFIPKQTVMVDDSEPVLAAAKNFGIGHVIAINKPDSALPKKDIDGYKNICFCDELIGVAQSG